MGTITVRLTIFVRRDAIWYPFTYDLCSGYRENVSSIHLRSDTCEKEFTMDQVL